MYGILRVNNSPSGNIRPFIQSCHKYPDICMNMSKYLQHACKCVNWHQTTYVQLMRVGHRIFVRFMPPCVHQVCIGSSLTNIAQHQNTTSESNNNNNGGQGRGQGGFGGNRWALPVLHYPRNMVIYHYPPVGVIFMVILYVFIIINYPNLFSNYHPKYKIWVIYPF